MRFLRNILLFVLAIILTVLAIGLFTNKDYAVEREIIIAKSQPEVFDYIKYLKNQDNYSTWARRDPKMLKTYKGTDGQVGFVSRWESEDPEVGVGEQEILKIEEGKRVDFELRFYEPFQSTEKAYLEVEAVDTNRTKVKWGFTGRFDYPMNLMLLFMDFEEAIGNDFEEGLANLKEEMEN